MQRSAFTQVQPGRDHRGYDKLRKTGKEFEPWFDTLHRELPGAGDYITLGPWENPKKDRRNHGGSRGSWPRGSMTSLKSTDSYQEFRLLSRMGSPCGIQRILYMKSKRHGITTLMALNILWR